MTDLDPGVTVLKQIGKWESVKFSTGAILLKSENLHNLWSAKPASALANEATSLTQGGTGFESTTLEQSLPQWKGYKRA